MQIGVIGTGKMGLLHVKKYAAAGFTVNYTDVPEKLKSLESDLYQTRNARQMKDGAEVSRNSELIFYLVPTEKISEVARKYGPKTKKGATVCSGTSVMTPAAKAFEEYMPEDVNIVNLHCLFGPSVDTKGQSAAVVRVRSTDRAYENAKDAFSVLGANLLELPTYDDHDRIMADVQVGTGMESASMGTAWKDAGFYPWYNASYTSVLDQMKILKMLRFFGAEAHVSGGIAMMNPHASKHVSQYAKSSRELLSLVRNGEKEEYRKRVISAGEKFFNGKDGRNRNILPEEIIFEYLDVPQQKPKPNSHLGPIVTIDAGAGLGIKLRKNLVFGTPPFRLRIGVAEYLFNHADLLEESLEAPFKDLKMVSDDTYFNESVKKWTGVITGGYMERYKKLFNETKEFFKDMMPEGMKKSDQLIGRLMEATRK